jgi:hypothetical protein
MGKGDRDRTTDRKRYGDNYDKMVWTEKGEESSEADAHRACETRGDEWVELGDKAGGANK